MLSEKKKVEKQKAFSVCFAGNPHGGKQRVAPPNSLPENTTSISASSCQGFEGSLGAAVFYLNLFCVSINKMCPKISEKPKKLFWESESAQTSFHINYSNLICLTSFCLTKCFIGMLYVQIGETSQSFILWI